jgi:hypothetical protein
LLRFREHDSSLAIFGVDGSSREPFAVKFGHEFINRDIINIFSNVKQEICVLFVYLIFCNFGPVHVVVLVPLLVERVPSERDVMPEPEGTEMTHDPVQVIDTLSSCCLFKERVAMSI